MKRYQRVLLDTSAIVAIFQPQEVHHVACVEILRQIDAPLITSWPVITEAHYLLRRDSAAQAKLLSLAKSESITLPSLNLSFIEWCTEFAERYHDHEVQIADASLVWLAEQCETNVVFTLDQRDFSTFKKQNGRETESFHILPEP